ncbi:hypothetical protein KFK09_023726 [Dendrobium nobile]|uniref:Uncharacterized protein n=1 Tax=Dendrobium nobile TaxID=94219 RepID=A0A8T3AB10_DENNO|nr:hypothetical protein KFK09_023726 [Dendrobium nobile]
MLCAAITDLSSSNSSSINLSEMVFALSSNVLSEMVPPECTKEGGVGFREPCRRQMMGCTLPSRQRREEDGRINGVVELNERENLGGR